MCAYFFVFLQPIRVSRMPQFHFNSTHADEEQILRFSRPDLRLPPGRISHRRWRTPFPRHSPYGDYQAIWHATKNHLPAQNNLPNTARQTHVQRSHSKDRLPRQLQLLHIRAVMMQNSTSDLQYTVMTILFMRM